MSRSVKKSGWCTDGRDGRKWWKNQANRKLRNAEEVPNGKAYKKLYESWNIHDYRFQVDLHAWWFAEKPWKYLGK